jgi:hypothetical protein
MQCDPRIARRSTGLFYSGGLLLRCTRLSRSFGGEGAESEGRETLSDSLWLQIHSDARPKLGVIPDFEVVFPFPLQLVKNLELLWNINPPCQ